MAYKNRRRRTRNFLTLLISTFIIVYYLAGIGLNLFLPSPDQSTIHPDLTPTVSGVNLVVRRFDNDGLPSYKLTASSIDYFESPHNKNEINRNNKIEQDFHDLSLDIDNYTFDNDGGTDSLKYARVMQPLIQIYELSKTTTDISSSLAYLTQSGERAELIGNVRVNDYVTSTHLTTSALTLDTHLKQIWTKKPVKIKTPSSLTTATGLQGNLSDQRWHLLSEVISVVQP